MADKSGGDAIQGNVGMQGNLSAQDMNAVGAAGAGILEGMGGSAYADAFGTQTVTQNQNQSNTANTGDGGDDNVHADTNVNV